MKKLLTASALALGFIAAPASAGTIELSTGHENTSLELSVGTDLAPKLSIFAYNQTTVDYEGNAGIFGLLDLNLELAPGLKAIAEGQVAGGEFTPKAGLSYFTEIGDGALFTHNTVSFEGDPTLTTMVNLSFRPEIAENLKLVLEAQNTTNLGKEGHNSSSQKLRAGLGIGNYEFGAAANLAEAADQLNYNLGLFGRVNF